MLTKVVTNFVNIFSEFKSCYKYIYLALNNMYLQVLTN